MRRHAIAALGFTALAIALTWPLAASFTSQLAGQHYDAFQNLWNCWWLRRSIGQLRNPFFTDLLWWPSGASLVFQTWDLPHALATALFWPLGPFAAYNLAFLASFVLC